MLVYIGTSVVCSKRSTVLLKLPASASAKIKRFHPNLHLGRCGALQRETKGARRKWNEE